MVLFLSSKFSNYMIISQKKHLLSQAYITSVSSMSLPKSNIEAVILIWLRIQFLLRKLIGLSQKRATVFKCFPTTVRANVQVINHSVKLGLQCIPRLGLNNLQNIPSLSGKSKKMDFSRKKKRSKSSSRRVRWRDRNGTLALRNLFGGKREGQIAKYIRRLQSMYM